MRRKSWIYLAVKRIIKLGSKGISIKHKLHKLKYEVKYDK